MNGAPTDFDSELQRHNRVLRRACRARPYRDVLDVGCGTGLTTRQAARTDGRALGVDISPAAIARARALTRAAGMSTVDFECADAQRHPLPAGGFDLAISRFGTMFFTDPKAAFGNIGRALRPGGRLVMLVWQAQQRNEWAVVVHEALDAGAPIAGPDPFSLADPDALTDLLAAAGFVDVECTDVNEPVHYGHDVAAAVDWVRGFSYTAAVLRRLDADAAGAALARLTDVLAGHRRADGVWLGSRAWLATAERA